MYRIMITAAVRGADYRVGLCLAGAVQPGHAGGGRLRHHRRAEHHERAAQ